MNIAGSQRAMHDPTWTIRLLGGLSILAALAGVDLYRNPRNPTRIKEYGFLFGVTALSIAYGIAIDSVTYTISWEYFAIGKGLQGARHGFYPEVVVLAAKGAWSAGLVVGVVMLVANNPHKHLPQLPYRTLGKLLVLPWSLSLIMAVVLGVSAFVAAPMISGQIGLDAIGLRNVSAFITAWGAHIGLYAGGLLGLCMAAFWVRRKRRA